MEAERIREAVIDVEEHADLDRVLGSRIAHAGGTERLQIGRPHVRWGEREPLEKTEGGPDLRIDRRRAPIGQHRLHHLPALRARHANPPWAPVPEKHWFRREWNG